MLEAELDALGDPEVTPDRATADVLATLAALLGRDGTGQVQPAP